MKDREEKLVSQARAAHEESIDRLDAATRSRLTQARHAALAELERPSFRPGAWLPAGALAAAAVLAIALWTRPSGVDSVPSPGLVAGVAAEDDLELLAGSDDLDMLTEDVEFYAWAASVTDDNGIG